VAIPYVSFFKILLVKTKIAAGWVFECEWAAWVEPVARLQMGVAIEGHEGS